MGLRPPRNTKYQNYPKNETKCIANYKKRITAKNTYASLFLNIDLNFFYNLQKLSMFCYWNTDKKLESGLLKKI